MTGVRNWHRRLSYVSRWYDNRLPGVNHLKPKTKAKKEGKKRKPVVFC